MLHAVRIVFCLSLLLDFAPLRYGAAADWRESRADSRDKKVMRIMLVFIRRLVKRVVRQAAIIAPLI